MSLLSSFQSLPLQTGPTTTEIVIAFALVLWILAAFGIVSYYVQIAEIRAGGFTFEFKKQPQSPPPDTEYKLEIDDTTITLTEEEYQGLKKAINAIRSSDDDSLDSDNLSEES